VRMLVTQARPLLPLMFMESEPQTPSRQERRNESVGSCALSFMRASSSMRSLPSSAASIVCIEGLAA